MAPAKVPHPDGDPPRPDHHAVLQGRAVMELLLPSLLLDGALVCKYAPNIDPTSNSAHPVDIVRNIRTAEEAAPALVATPHEAQKTELDQTLQLKRQGVNIVRDFSHRVNRRGVPAPIGTLSC